MFYIESFDPQKSLKNNEVTLLCCTVTCPFIPWTPIVCGLHRLHVSITAPVVIDSTWMGIMEVNAAGIGMIGAMFSVSRVMLM